MADDKNVININGRKFAEKDLTGQQQYFILQIRDLQQKRAAAQFQVDQLAAGLDHFTKQLIGSVESNEQKDSSTAG